MYVMKGLEEWWENSQKDLECLEVYQYYKKIEDNLNSGKISFDPTYVWYNDGDITVERK